MRAMINTNMKMTQTEYVPCTIKVCCVVCMPRPAMAANGGVYREERHAHALDDENTMTVYALGIKKKHRILTLAKGTP